MKRLQRRNGNDSGDAEVFAPVDMKFPGILIPGGQYLAFCRAADIYFDGGFKRWTCLLDFDILSERYELVAKLPLWFNLGTAKKAQVTRRSNYLAAWVNANGEPPSRMDRMSPRVFLHRMCRVTVGDSKGAMPRSVVKEILSWETGSDIKSSALAGVEGSSTQLNPTGGRCSQGNGVRKGISEVENAN